MNNKKILCILLIFAILSTTSISFAAEKSWNDLTFEVPEGYSTGTSGVTKIGMMQGKESIILEEFNEEKLNELKEESEPKDNKTYKIGETDVTELTFEEDSGNVHFINFTKNDKAYDIVYKDIAAEDEEEEDDDSEDDSEDESEDAAEDNDTDDNSTDENATDEPEGNETSDDEEDEEDANFNVMDENNPVHVIINSIK